MAEASTVGAPLSSECGFCLRPASQLEDSKLLTCNHTHCLECLSGYMAENNSLICPVPNCGEICDVPLDDLPSHEKEGDDVKWCDSCKDNNVPNQTAVIYCTECDRTFCEKHKQTHFEAYRYHSTISTTDFISQAAKLRKRKCENHKEEAIIIGCKKCLDTACVKCLLEPTTCTVGGCDSCSSHEYIPLEDLVNQLLKDINELKDKMKDKEDKLETLFKLTSKATSQYEEETLSMIERIHKTRDEQIAALTEKYQELEDELILIRQTEKTTLAEFMEDAVLKKWKDLRNHRLMIDSRLKYSHQCDVVSGHKQTQEVLEKLLQELLPSLVIDTTVTLTTKDKDRAAELDTIKNEGVLFDIEHGLRNSTPLPKSLNLLKSIKLPTTPLSVSHYKGQSYVGLCNHKMVKISDSFEIDESFIKFDSYSYVSGIVIHKDRIYSLVFGSGSHAVYVHDMSGKYVTNWSHSDGADQYTGLAIVSDQIIIPNRSAKTLVVYSLTGKVINNITCSQLSTDYCVSICAVGGDSVVVSYYDNTQVFKVHIPSGRVLWTCNTVSYPLGVTCYGQKYILVHRVNSSEVNVLDSETGAVQSKLTDKAIGTQVCDMYMSGTTLLVAEFDSKSLLYYQLGM